jgi:glycosyltransferase involved in cell wall biosynthesis
MWRGGDARLRMTLPATCIMPTHDRRGFVPRAVALFLAQDFDGAELLVLDGGRDPVRDLVPEHPRVRYLREPFGTTIGARRNRLCHEARGDVIVHWDDDDWYPPWRVRAQLDALRDRGADAGGSGTIYYHDPAAGRAWRYAHVGGDPYVTGNTLAYRRAFWERNPFADIQVGEDTRFVRSVAAGRLVDLADPRLCVATLHPGNVSPKRPSGTAWSPGDLAVVRALLDGSVALPTSSLRVSCIMPTGDRRPFVALALEHFAAQTYPSRELVVVDGGGDPVADLCAGFAGVRHLRVAAGTSIGARRNLACEAATGDVIVHWDDDDWFGPERLARQLEPIEAGRADVTGLTLRHALQLPGGEFWATSEALHRRMFVGDVHGGTLAYRRALRDGGCRYPDVNLAEDAALLRDLLRGGARLERVDGEGLFVYTRHGRNAWRFEAGRFLDVAGWRRVERPAAMPAATVERYRAATGSPGSSPRPAMAHAPTRGLVDCLGAAEVVPSPGLPRAERCVAVVASEGTAALLDDLLTSLDRFGGLEGVPRVVFVEEGATACARVASRLGAATVAYRPLRRPSPTLKGVLYSAARVLEAEQFLLLDVDLLVLDTLAPLLDACRGEDGGRIHSAAESLPSGGRATLGEALRTIYRARAADVARLCGGASVEGFPRVINDGVLVAERGALLAVDEALRASPDLVAWVHAEPSVWWRQKAALNIVLARLGLDVALDGANNVQLHVERVERKSFDGSPGALWQGRRASVVHFNGSARRTQADWARYLLGGAHRSFTART